MTRETGRSPRSLRGLTAAMAVAMGAAPLSIYSISALSPVLIPALDLSRTQYGALATITSVAAALASRAAGRAVDRTGAWRVMWWLVLGAGGAMLAAAAAPGYVVLVLAVTASGVAQALSNPVTNQLAARWMPARSLGTTMGLKQSGVQMAQAASGLALPGLAVIAGWRGAMTLAAGACLLLGGTLVARYVPRDAPASGAKALAARSGSGPAVWWLTAFIFLTGAALQGVNFHLPLYGYETLGLSFTAAGMLAAIVGTVGVAARVAWGALAARMRARPALLAVSTGGAVAVLLILLASATPGLIWLGAVLLGATGIAANVVVMVNVLKVAEPTAIGRASGLVSLGMYAGFAAGPLAVGAVADAAGDYAPAWWLLAALYLAAAGSVAGFSRAVRT